MIIMIIFYGVKLYTRRWRRKRVSHRRESRERERQKAMKMRLSSRLMMSKEGNDGLKLLSADDEKWSFGFRREWSLGFEQNERKEGKKFFQDLSSLHLLSIVVILSLDSSWVLNAFLSSFFSPSSLFLSSDLRWCLLLLFVSGECISHSLGLLVLKRRSQDIRKKRSIDRVICLRIWKREARKVGKKKKSN